MRRFALLLLVALLLIVGCTYNVELAGYRAVGGVYPIVTGDAQHDDYPTPTPDSAILPTTTPTPEPESQMCTVTSASGVIVRSGPGTSYARIGGVRAGAVLAVIGEAGDWLQIENPAGYVAGWLCSG